MTARFPLYTDADIEGPVVDALVHHGWDVMRAVDVFPEGTHDDVHFARAASEGRVMVGNDRRLHASDHPGLRHLCRGQLLLPRIP